MTPGSLMVGRVSRLVKAALPRLMPLAAPAGPPHHPAIPAQPHPATPSLSHNHPPHMTASLVNQSMRMRLGTVSTASTQRFTLQLHQISPTGELQLLADPVGSRRTFTSEPIHVFAGQAVEWIIQADVRQSTLTIRS